MRTVRLTNCFKPLQKLKARLGPLNRFKPPVILYYWPFKCGTTDVVLSVACFGVGFCTVFTFYVSRLFS